MKQLINKSWLIALAVVIVASCQKDAPVEEPETSLYAQVVEKGTEKGIPGATMGLVRHEGDAFGFKRVLVAETFTDSNGYFYFDLPQPFGLTVTAGQWTYFPSGYVSIDEERFKKSKKIYLNPESYLKLHIKNINPYDDA